MNLYDVLEVPMNASMNDIRRAYHRRAVQLHPDKNKAPHAEAAFYDLSCAYQTLSDEKQRQLYDQELINRSSWHHDHPPFLYIIPLDVVDSRRLWAIQRQPQVRFLKSVLNFLRKS